MKPVCRRLMLVTLLALSLYGCANSSDAQEKKAEGNKPVGAAIIPREANEGLVVLDYDQTQIVESLDSLLKLPPPRIRFIFDCTSGDMLAKKCGDKFSSAAPKEIDAELRSFWTASLRFNYRDLVEKFPDAQSDTNESLRFSNTANEFGEHIRHLTITTDRGERKISGNEADEVVKAINRKTAELVRGLESRTKPVDGNR